MPITKTITIVGVSLIFLYVLTQILNFYGVSTESYGIYLGFFAFMLMSMFVLPTADSTL